MVQPDLPRVWKRWLSVALVYLLAPPAVAPAIGGQAQAGPKLKIVILEGEGAINNIRQRTAREPIVEIQDENDRPVAGAVVVFALPDRGPSGVFANNQTSMTVTTNAQGRATGTGLRPNSVEGSFQVRVTASYQGQTASAIVSQSNGGSGVAPGGGGGAGKIAAILVVVAGAAAGGAIAATRSGNKGGAAPAPPPAASPTTFTPGTPTVLPPR